MLVSTVQASLSTSSDLVSISDHEANWIKAVATRKNRRNVKRALILTLKVSRNKGEHWMHRL
jgi:hypothetical protein